MSLKIPYNPPSVYKGVGWKNWGHFYLQVNCLIKKTQILDEKDIKNFQLRTKHIIILTGKFCSKNKRPETIPHDIINAFKPEQNLTRYSETRNQEVFLSDILKRKKLFIS